MPLEDLWATLRSDPAGAIIVTAAAFALADFITGFGAAARARTVQVSLLAEWVSGHLLGRVLPIAGVALLGQFLAVDPLFAIAGLALGTYVVESSISIKDNLLVRDSAPSNQ